MGGTRNAYKGLFEKPKKKKEPLCTYGHKYKVRIKTETKRIQVVDWIHHVQDRDQCRAFVITVMNLRILQYAGTFLTTWANISFSTKIRSNNLVTIIPIDWSVFTTYEADANLTYWFSRI
jgi:hypothetical protein